MSTARRALTKTYHHPEIGLHATAWHLPQPSRSGDCRRDAAVGRGPFSAPSFRSKDRARPVRPGARRPVLEGAETLVGRTEPAVSPTPVVGGAAPGWSGRRGPGD